jgi:hypothetical protein
VIGEGNNRAHASAGVNGAVAAPTVVIGAEIAFASGRNRLAGSIFVPPGKGPFPAAVYIGGAGWPSYHRWWEGAESGFMVAQLKGW